jgi:hypothetical protein
MVKSVNSGHDASRKRQTKDVGGLWSSVALCALLSFGSALAQTAAPAANPQSGQGQADLYDFSITAQPLSGALAASNA